MLNETYKNFGKIEMFQSTKPIPKSNLQKVLQPLRKLENSKFPCPRCNGRTIKNYFYNGKPRRKCKDCGKQYVISMEDL